jgi:hypothetical protein
MTGSQPSEQETASSVAVVEAADPVDVRIPHEEVARLAYSYWEARGFYGGRPEEDWLRAEEELKKAARGSAA